MTDRTPATPAPPPHQPSFARRHPILTGFGILAGLSLFATYFPISAIVTAVAVGAHATGADRVALTGARRALRWVVSHRPHAKRGAISPSPESGRAAGDPDAAAVERTAPSHEAAASSVQWGTASPGPASRKAEHTAARVRRPRGRAPKPPLDGRRVPVRAANEAEPHASATRTARGPDQGRPAELEL